MAPCRTCSKQLTPSRLQSLKFRFNKTKAFCGAVVNLWKINPKLLLSQFGIIGKLTCKPKVDTKMEYADNITNEEKEEIYKQLIANPKLHIIHNDVDIISTDTETKTKKTARYYAARLWNWRLSESNVHFHKYIKNYLILTVKYMCDQDMLIIKTILTQNHPECLVDLKNDEFKKLYLKKLIFKGDLTVTFILEAIHDWFLLMPVLTELAKLLGWEFLNSTKACLLDVDVLYTVFLNVVYKTPQTKSPIYT